MRRPPLPTSTERGSQSQVGEEPSRKLRVGLCVYDLEPGGAQQVVRLLTRFLDSRRFDIIIYTIRGGALESSLKADGLKVHTTQQLLPYLDPILAWRLYKQIHRDRLDLLHTHLFGADLHGALATALPPHIPLIITIHQGTLDNLRQRTIARMVYSRAARIMAVAPRIAHYLYSAWPSLYDRVRVIENGVALSPAPLTSRSALRTQLGLPQRALVIGTVGRLTPAKAHADLLTAFRCILQTRHDSRLVIVGDGELRPILASKALDLGVSDNTHFYDGITEASHLLPAFDLFVLSSRAEGLPLALLEAMAASLPCVCTSVGEIPSIIEHGKNGYLTPPASPRVLAETIMSVLNDASGRAVCAAAARATVKARYSVETMVDRYAQEYSAVAATARSFKDQTRF